MAPERTKNERSNERAVSDLWDAYRDEFDGSLLKLTVGRKRTLELLKREQLDHYQNPLALFRAILAAVRASSHHMSDRAYLMPESLFRNAERRERWAMKGLDQLSGNGTGAATSDPMMYTAAELRGSK